MYLLVGANVRAPLGSIRVHIRLIAFCGRNTATSPLLILLFITIIHIIHDVIEVCLVYFQKPPFYLFLFLFRKCSNSIWDSVIFYHPKSLIIIYSLI